jgi:hypothetical protein
MNKEFVPYELALKLKQLGFDEPCIATHGYLELYINTDDGHLKAPTFSQAFRWFREDLTCDSWIRPNLVIDGPKIYQFLINDKLDDEWYETYEEAELACLTKLIDLKSE